jgi:hypothetical protein
MARMLLFLFQRLEAVLEGFKVGTQAADYRSLVYLVEEVVRWLSVNL